jgi:hypothetical protein
MQLIANGPDIPAAVLHSQEEERLVFFCGAGISMPSGLPNFKRLVEDVRDELGAEFTPQEKREFDAEAARSVSKTRCIVAISTSSAYSDSVLNRLISSVPRAPAAATVRGVQADLGKLCNVRS